MVRMTMIVMMLVLVVMAVIVAVIVAAAARIAMRMVSMGVRMIVVIVPVTMPMIVAVIVAVMIVRMRLVSTADRIERCVDRDRPGAKRGKQLLDRRIALHANPFLQDLHRNVTVAKMPGEPRQRRQVRGARLDQRKRGLQPHHLRMEKHEVRYSREHLRYLGE